MHFLLTMRFVWIVIFLMNFHTAFAEVHPKKLSEQTLDRFDRVPEFKFIIQEANKLGVKVYLFGGTASAFAHYVRWDLERKAGDTKYQEERFDYDFINIYRGNQDLDIVVDGSPKQADILKEVLQQRYPHFVGSREAWEVRLLRQSRDDKRALLGDADFKRQHSDTNSTGILLLNPDEGDIIYNDLLNWGSRESDFLNDVSQAKIKFLFGEDHESTERFKKGLNPPVLAAIRYLAKLAQYEVKGTDEDLALVTKIIDETDFMKLSDYGKKKAEEFGLKALLNSPDSEYAWNLLEKTGARKKLIKMDGDRFKTIGALSWWMNKEPLRSTKIGQGEGKRARDLFPINENGDIIVSHETNSFDAYENIVRSSSGKANVFISRDKVVGEAAYYGDGFYTLLGNQGGAGTGLTARFILNPEAREGSDFNFEKNGIIIIQNKAALQLIPENIDIKYIDFINLFLNGGLTEADLGKMYKLKRKFKRYDMNAEEIEELNHHLVNLEWSREKINLMFELMDWLVPQKIIHEEFWHKLSYMHFLFQEMNLTPSLKKIMISNLLKMDMKKLKKDIATLSELLPNTTKGYFNPRKPETSKSLIFLILSTQSYLNIENKSELIKKNDKYVTVQLKALSAAIDWTVSKNTIEEKDKFYESILDILIGEVKGTVSKLDDASLIWNILRLQKSKWENLKYKKDLLFYNSIPYMAILMVYTIYQYFGIELTGESFAGYAPFVFASFFTTGFYGDVFKTLRARVKFLERIEAKVLEGEKDSDSQSKTDHGETQGEELVGLKCHSVL